MFCPACRAPLRGGGRFGSEFRDGDVVECDRCGAVMEYFEDEDTFLPLEDDETEIPEGDEL